LWGLGGPADGQKVAHMQLVAHKNLSVDQGGRGMRKKSLPKGGMNIHLVAGKLKPQN